VAVPDSKTLVLYWLQNIDTKFGRFSLCHAKGYQANITYLGGKSLATLPAQIGDILFVFPFKFLQIPVPYY
jgi:hypothetical protein